MSSRQQQKERRKQERLERERREKQAEQRKKLGQILSGVAIVAAIIVGVILAASGGGGGTETGSVVEGEAPDAVAPPVQRLTDLKVAVRNAGCAFREFPSEGSDHVEDELTAADYKTNPPTSGRHNPVWATDGYYPPGEQPALKNSIHALEHGRVLFQYNAKLPLQQQKQLRGLFNEDIGGAGARYHALMFQSNSNMKYMVAAVAWRSYVVCNTMSDGVFDAFRAFYRAKLDKGPEQVP